VSATFYTIIGLIIAAVSSIVLPYWLDHHKQRGTIEQQESMDSQAVAQMFKGERDRLQLRLDTMQADYERRIAALRQENRLAVENAEREWKTIHERDQQQIIELRAELQQLYRQLYRSDPK
jgi:uncharacterized membrane protein YgaE (UPF0421/DUF939 family)